MLFALVGLLVISLACSGALFAQLAKLTRLTERSDNGSLAARCESLEAGQKRLEELLRTEMAQNRRESVESLGHHRDALTGHIGAVTTAMNELRGALGSSLSEVFARHREASANEARTAREEVGAAVKTQGDLLLVQHKSAVEFQIARLEAIESLLGKSHEKTQSDAGQLREGVIKALEALRVGLIEKIEAAATLQREGHATEAKRAREEVALLLQRHGESLKAQLHGVGEAQQERLNHLHGTSQKAHAEAGALRDKVLESLDSLRAELSGHIAKNGEFARLEAAANAKQARDEAALALRAQGEALEAQLRAGQNAQRERLETLSEFLKTLVTNHRVEAGELRKGLDGALSNINALLREQNGTIAKGQSEQTSAVTRTLEAFAAKVRDFETRTEATLEKLREGVEKKLGDLQNGNEKKLEEMRNTVDEKLQSTLESRLGQSFQVVNEQLRMVERGLGEMQALASGVGDLKKVLSNVKTRGNWGEVQLGNLLEQVMAPGQYSTNVAVTGGRERVEFAIKLPGRDDAQDQIWLPIDAKFPQEAYARLIAAEEAGDLDARDAASRELEQVVKKCADDICRKYICPPQTTDFALLYLPTEGLYAEVVKRTEVVEHLHRHCRVVIAGPTTIAALLNSLQMGFRTLEIQKNSSKINDVLVSVKTEFGKYATVLEKIKRNLDTAQNTVEEAQKRTGILTRKLDRIEATDASPSSKNLVLSAAEPPVDGLELSLAQG